MCEYVLVIVCKLNSFGFSLQLKYQENILQCKQHFKSPLLLVKKSLGFLTVYEMNYHHLVFHM